MFPVSRVPFKAEPLTGYDVSYAIDQLHWRGVRLRVQYHAGLEALLSCEASRIADRPIGRGFAVDHYNEELQNLCSVTSNHQACIRNIDLKMLKAHHREQLRDGELEYELCKASFQHLGNLISTFCENSEDNFKDLPLSLSSDGWKWLAPAESHSLSTTEWVAMFRDRTRAVCQWKLNLTSSDMQSIRAGGTGRAPGDWTHALHPGFSISGIDDSQVHCTSTKVHPNGVLACVMVRRSDRAAPD